MRVRSRQRNVVWLGLLAALVGVGLISGGLPIQAAILALGLLGGAAAFTLLDLQPSRVLEQSRSSLTTLRMSPDAREASERARRRGSILPASTGLIDIGLIATQTDQEGMDMRRTRTVSRDDDGVRPFVTLHVQPQAAEREAKLRFEMIDSAGHTRYVHEMKTYLRDGEMNILTDHQLPLRVSDIPAAVGDWDLRVSLDGALLAMHHFTVSPSVSDRLRRYDDAPAAQSQSTASPARQPSAETRARLSADDEPMSLEDLLRQSRADESQAKGRSNPSRPSQQRRS